MGLRPARGEWAYRLLTSNSTATFVEGSLVAFDVRRRVIEYSSVKSAALGIAMTSSANSLAHPNKCIVAVPAGRECTFWAPTGTLAQSSVSLGQAVGISKSGNTFDQVDATITSTISVIGIVYGPIVDTSTVSVCEVAWQVGQGVWFSGSSNTFLT